MKFSLLLTLFPLLLFLRCSSSTSSGYELCNWLGGYYITYDSCVSSLQPDPSSKTASYHQLAVISLNLTITNATAVQSKFETITGKERDNKTKSLLYNCLDLYTDNVPSLRLAANEAVSKNYTGAAEVVFKFSSMPGACDDKFRDKKGVDSPLMRENLDLMNLALVAHAINDYLSNYY
nr:daylily invertase inhibitor [Hemerocallis fulva]